MRDRVILLLVLCLSCGQSVLALDPVAADKGDRPRPAVGTEPQDKKTVIATNISFRRDVWPIVKRHCRGCHTGTKSKGGLSMDGVAAMRKGGDSGTLFEPGNPQDSLLIQMISGDEPEMPKQQPPLSAVKIRILREWILGGGKDDSIPSDHEPPIRIPETYKYAPAVNSVAFNPNGKLLATACRSEVVLINAATGAPERRLPTQCDLLTHVEFSPNGELLAAVGGTPSRFGEVSFFNPVNGALIASRRGTHDTFFRGGFAPDSSAIAVGGADGAIHIVPIDAKLVVKRIELHSDWVLDVVFTPDGKKLVSGGRDKATKISSFETGKLLRLVGTAPELVSSVASDSNFAISSGRGKLLTGFEYKNALMGIELAGAGNLLRPISKRDQYVRAFEDQPGEVLDIASSGDRKLLAVSGKFATVRVYRVADRKQIALISNVPAPIHSVALDQHGTRLALGSANGRVQIYEIPSTKLLRSFVPVPIAAVIDSTQAIR